MPIVENVCQTLQRLVAPIWPWRDLLLVVLTPLLLSPLVFAFEDAERDTKMSMRAAFVIAVMVLYWTTESMPIAVTAFLPLICYPLLGVAKSNDVAPQYFNESTMAFFGTVIVISALQQANVHRRFALVVLNTVGAQPRWLLLGIMVTPWFLSMWMANTMTTLLMVPIIAGLVEEMKTAVEQTKTHSKMKPLEMARHYGEAAIASSFELATMARTETEESIETTFSTTADEQHQVRIQVGGDDTETCPPSGPKIPVRSSKSTNSLAGVSFEQEFDASKLEAMLLLAAAYSSSIGGFTTILGTAPNMILKSSVDVAFEESGCPSPLNFMSFMIFALPVSMLFTALAWIWLLIFFFGPRYTFGLAPSPFDQHRESIQRSLRQLYEKLQPMAYRQWAIIGHCIVMVVLMVTRQLSTNPVIGWDIISPGAAKESVATFLVALSLFVFPGSKPNERHLDRPGSLITWKDIEKDFPIGVLLMIGGGTAAAFGAEKSGLASKMSHMLNNMTSSLDDATTIFVLVTIVVLVTEVMSNTACVTLMMPILRRLAEMRHRNPLLYMFPIALGTSFAFMFPVSTPPNAIVFATGKIRMTQMIGVGIVMNVIGIGCLNLATNTWGDAYFNFYGEPIVMGGNVTCF